MNNDKSVIVTGAAGFAGYSLTMHLLMHSYKVIAVVRPGSRHNNRLEPGNLMNTIEIDSDKCGLRPEIDEAIIKQRLKVVELDSSEYSKLPEFIDCECEAFYHLTWAGGRDDFQEQMVNIDQSVAAIEAAAKIGCKRFICTGSQAEYGVCNDVITEELCPKPVNAYGAAKVAAMYLTKRRAEQIGIEWIWGRIFSLYGLYEQAGRMLPDLIRKLSDGETVSLSDCSQNWDYLDACDAAEAIIALGERGRSGEIYNIARGDYKPLKSFVKEMEEKYSNGGTVIFGERAKPYVSLSPSVEKIKNDTGWEPKVAFLQDYSRIMDRE
ncbi:NAD-dependent epimerase/dehydratase family protein [Butyrivibrio sp. MB2005]|uniref:NAD-dependent epimerase/dehydratase family protein n=1 Tax=Butyrivibrio sp. MB2005 TaxID=1280678 RepID=UPI000418D16A|nr:NAD(P)-dependent oxidoreductase [Butyrivibrio sp. MB2005]